MRIVLTYTFLPCSMTTSDLSSLLTDPFSSSSSPSSQYIVEWDTVSTFNSGSSGQPLGVASVNAYTVACTGCVSAITFPYNTATTPTATITYTGNSNTVLMLRAGVRVVIVTTDDHLPYTFVVADVQATTSSFTVQVGPLIFPSFPIPYTLHLSSQSDPTNPPSQPPSSPLITTPFFFHPSMHSFHPTTVGRSA